MDLDSKLVFSCEKFEDVLVSSKELFDRDGILDDANEHMLAPHPGPAELAWFAKAAYDELEKNDNGSSYQNKLPSGWKLLTTACNDTSLNGYHGAAYWSPSLQRVVLAHRGTVPSNLGAWWTNVRGVVFKNFSRRMSSAATFADKVKCAIDVANKQTGKQFQLSITGHSLGGWLAQVTGLSVKHLEVEGGKFRTREQGKGIHAHVVAFDTPGCKHMLEELVDNYWNRHEKKVSLEMLDISCYLSAPNHINTFGLHVGSVYRVMVDVSNLNILERMTPKYSLATHRMDNFIQAFKEEREIHEMKDWPSSNREYKDFYDKVRQADDYHMDLREYDEVTMETRYKVKDSNKSGSLRIFSEDELNLLIFWNIFKTEKVKNNIIEKGLESRHYSKMSKDLSVNFLIDIYNHTITCDSKEDLDKVVRRTKLSVRWFSAELMAAVDQQSKDIPKVMYSIINRKCLNSLPECLFEFTVSIKLREFLKSTKHRVWQIKTEDCHLEMFRLFNMVDQLQKQPSQADNKYVKDGHQTFLDWNDIDILEDAIVIEKLSNNDFTNDNLLVINCALTDVSQYLESKKIFKRFRDNNDKKLIFVTARHDLNFSFFDLPVFVSPPEISVFESNQLTQHSRENLFKKKILDIEHNLLSIEDFVGEKIFDHFSLNIDGFIDQGVFKNILKNKNFIIKVPNLCQHLLDHGVNFSTIGREVSVEGAASSGALLVVSGSPPQGLREKLAGAVWVTENGEERFKQVILENPDKKVYWLEANDSSILIAKQVYFKNLYMRRQFHHQIAFKLKEFAAQSEDKDILIIQNAPETMRDKYKKNEHIHTAASDEEVKNILKENDKKSVHLLKFDETGERFLWECLQGSLKSLHTYIHSDIEHAVDEEKLYTLNRKIMIIADEPGMGKSSSLASMARLLQADRANWVVWFNLKSFRVPSEELPQEPKERSECLLRNNLAGGSLPLRLLQLCLHNKEHSRQVYFMFDGFDELNDSNGAKNEVLNLLKYLSDETFARVWVTTRFHERESLELALSTFSVTFQKIESEKQEDYLVNFWLSHLLLDLGDCGEEKRSKLEECARDLLTKAKNNLGEDIQSFMGVPLQLRMLADVFLEKVEDYLTSGNVKDAFIVDDVFSLYAKFIDVKYNIYLSDKTEIRAVINADLIKTNVANFTHSFGMLAFQVLFPDFAEEHCEQDDKDVSIEDLCRIGLIQFHGDGTKNIEFIHRTLAEYFCARQVVDWLRKKGPNRTPALKLLLTDILLQSQNVISKFIDSFLLQQPTLDLARNYTSLQSGKLLDESHLLTSKDKRTALHIAAKENNRGVIQLLIESLGIEPQGLLKLIEARNNTNSTALHLATLQGHTATVQYLVEKGSDINSAGKDGWTALHCASRGGHTATVQYLLEKSADINSANKDGWTALHRAARRGHTATVEYLLEKSADIYSADNFGWTALHHAAREGHTATVQYLLEKGADINSANKDGWTALHRAARRGHTATVEYLLEKSADIYSADKDGWTALHRAARRGHTATVEYLLEKSADIYSADKDGWTALHCASRGGHTATVQYLLEKSADINSANKDGWTALHHAAREGHTATVQYLLEKSADINSADKDGWTALHCASLGGHTATVQYLLEKGADINSANKDGWTALHRAARRGHTATVEYLLEKSADIYSADNFGWTALHHAAREGHTATVQYLLEKSADINSADKDGWTALHCASLGGHTATVQYLLEKSGDINSADKNGWTALHCASLGGHKATVQYLLEKGADINSAFTALHCASRGGHTATVEYLLEKSADINSSDKDGWTALHHAAQKGHTATVQYLLEKGADTNSASKNGWTAVDCAAREGHTATVQYLLEKGADINSASKNGWTAVDCAAREVHTATVQYLLEKGADINSASKNGWTAVDCAAREGHTVTVQYLLEKGADINSASKIGWTAVDCAAREGHTATVQYLVKKSRFSIASAVFCKDLRLHRVA